MKKFKPSKKHLKIFETIKSKGKYKPAYSDQEPATETLVKKEIIKWKDDYRGLIFTEHGKKAVKENGWGVNV